MQDKNHYDELLEKYYSQASDWNYDLHDAAEVQKNRYFLFAVLAALVTLASVFAVARLTPLKETVPYLYQVDKATGEVNDVSRIDMTTYRPPDKVTMHFIAQYIQAREAVDRKDHDKRFRRVQMLSSKSIATGFVDDMENSPRSPLVMFAEDETREVYIRDILKLNKRDAYHIEIETTDTLNQSPRPVTLYWAIVLEYRYINMPGDNQYRYDNPLGFQVTYYNKDQKVIR